MYDHLRPRSYAIRDLDGVTVVSVTHRRNTVRPTTETQEHTMKRIILPTAAITTAALATAGLAATTGLAATHATTPTAHAARSTTLRLTADPHGNMRFNTKRLSAHAGRVTIVLTNPRSSGMPHGIAIKGPGVNRSGKVVGPGGRSTVSVTLKRGKYTFFCPVPGHAAAGMTGTLTVQ